MSNMLDQAIIDAEALKEAAIKNAEAAIVEKYSDDIKQAVNQLLEQAPSPEEMAMMGGMMGAPPPPGTLEAPGGMDAGADVAENTPETYMNGVQTVHIPLHELVQEMKMDDLSPSEKQIHELVAEEVTGGNESASEEEEETFTIQESVFASILGEEFEGLYEDKGPSGKRGSTGPFDGEVEHEDELEEQESGDMPYKGSENKGGYGKIHSLGKIPADTPVESPALGRKPVGKAPTSLVKEEENELEGDQDELDVAEPKGKLTGADFEKLRQTNEQLRAYQYNYAKLSESHKKYEQYSAQLQQQAAQLNEQNNKFKELLVRAQQRLNEVNVRNAQLHYTNRTLLSDSLNERQKDKIVEAIAKAGTVEETKVIFEALQSAVAGAKSNQNAPKSLNEAINKNSSAFLPRKEEARSDPTLVNRMQKLAGIN